MFFFYSVLNFFYSVEINVNKQKACQIILNHNTYLTALQQYIKSLTKIMLRHYKIYFWFLNLFKLNVPLIYPYTHASEIV